MTATPDPTRRPQPRRRGGRRLIHAAAYAAVRGAAGAAGTAAITALIYWATHH
jgi:hypothetical protein